jgi:hypothetical protein
MRNGWPALGAAIVIAAQPAQAASWTIQSIASSAAGNQGGFTHIDASNGVPAVNDAGAVAFAAAATVKGVPQGGAWLWQGGKAPKLLATTQQPDDLAVQATINRNGGVSFSDVVAFGTQTTTIIRVSHGVETVFPAAYPGEAFSAILSNDDVLAQSGGALLLLSGTGSRQVNSGTCDGAFSVAASGAGAVAYSDCLYRNIYVTKAAKAKTKLRVEGYGAQGTGAVGSPAINAGGTVVFLANAVSGQTGSNVNAVYTETASGRYAVVTFTNNGTCTPSGPPGGAGSCTYVAYGPAAINAGGAVAVPVYTTLWTGTSPTISAALTLNGDLANGTVLATGAVVDGCTISGISTGPQAINASGQMAAQVGCEDGSQRILLATPQG